MHSKNTISKKVQFTYFNTGRYWTEDKYNTYRQLLNTFYYGFRFFLFFFGFSLRNSKKWQRNKLQDKTIYIFIYINVSFSNAGGLGGWEGGDDDFFFFFFWASTFYQNITISKTFSRGKTAMFIFYNCSSH